MKILSRISIAVRLAALALPILLVTACEPPGKNGFTQTPFFIGVNYFDDSTAHVDLVAESMNGATIGTNLGFGEVTSPIVTTTDIKSNFIARLTGASANVAETGLQLVYNYNIVIAYGTPATPEIQDFVVQAQVPPLIKFIHVNHIQTSGYDVYVTAPGADITTLQPDAVDVDYSDSIDLKEAAHVGANFQVRICTTGTKNIVGVFNPIASAEAETAYVFIAGLGGATTDVAQFQLNTSTTAGL